MSRRKCGDRKDGKLLRDIDSMHFIVPVLYPNRADNEAFISESIPLAPIQQYVDKQNENESDFRYTFFHIIVAAMAKTLTLRPKMNRFIQNSNLYQRNEISLAFVVKKKFNDTAEEALAVIKVQPDDTVFTIHDKIRSQVLDCRSDKADASTDSMNTFQKIPRVLSKFAIRRIMWLDKHGRVPQSLIATDPFYQSVVLSNLGSIKLKSGYHHLTNWGTCSVFCTIGEKEKVPVIASNGSISVEEQIGLGLTVDERIADGYYYSKTVQLLKHLLVHPEELEKPLSEEVFHD